MSIDALDVALLVAFLATCFAVSLDNRSRRR
jgi:hypothetical protein